MSSFARILFCSVALMSLSVSPMAYADDEDGAPSRRETAKEKKERRNRNKEEAAVAAPKGSFEKEIAALLEAEAMLVTVNDEAKATEVSEAICKKFSALPPILNGVDNELLQLARAQNKVSRQMSRLLTAPFFEKSGLQEAWTMMTDPFSRRSATKHKK